MRTNHVLAVGCVAVLAAAGAAEAAGYRLDRTVELAAGGELSLHSESGSVEVRGVDGSQARILIDSSHSDFTDLYDVRVEQPSPGRLEVTIERRGRGPLRWFGPSGRTRVEVELPRSASAEIRSSGGGVDVSTLDGRVKATSSGGRLFAERIGGDVVLSSSGGGVEARDVGGSARVDSSGGSVTVVNVRGDIDAGSSGGGVRITGAGGYVEASSSGGPVKVELAAGNARGGNLHSSGGGIEVRVDPAVSLDVDAHSSGGSVSCDLPVTVRGKLSKSSLVGKLNGGGEELRVRSSGGGVRIEAR